MYTNIYMYIYMYIHTYIYIYICIYIYIYVYQHVYTYIRATQARRNLGSDACRQAHMRIYIYYLELHVDIYYLRDIHADMYVYVHVDCRYILPVHDVHCLQYIWP
jgi:hypothetical protein